MIKRMVLALGLIICSGCIIQKEVVVNIKNADNCAVEVIISGSEVRDNKGELSAQGLP